MRTYLTHARIVLPDEMIEDGALLIEDGVIAAIEPCTPRTEIEIDLKGCLLLPGLIDLHNDEVEKAVEPRPNVRFPLDFAVETADRCNAMQGITTVYDCLCFANDLGVRSNETAAEIVAAIRRFRPYALIDHRVHCRYEVTNEEGVPQVAQMFAEGRIDLLSLMDHTPGQGQFKTLAAFQDYLMHKYAQTEEEAAAVIARKTEDGAGTPERVRALIEMTAAYGVPLATHDDDSPERVRRLTAMGASISEFPITLETAQTAHACGMTTVFGAPNLLRGASQSGSMRALDALHADAADCLCSDYLPASLAPALLRVTELCGWSLPRAVRLATLHAAEAVGLKDRGAIAVGLRADLAAMRLIGGYAHIAATWVEGRLVAQAGLRRPLPECNRMQ